MIVHEKIHFEITKFIVKPAIICGVVYIIIKEVYKVTLINSELLKTAMSVAMGMVFYVISIIFTKLITKKEIKIITKKG